MALHSSAGTCLSVFAGLPATYDAQGFGTLAFTTVGELESIGGMEIRRNTGTFSNLCTKNSSTIKGSRQAMTISVVAALDEDDAGQIMMIASEAEDDELYSFCVEESNGVKNYFVGTVIACGKTFGGDTDPVKAPYDIAVQAVHQMSKPILIVPVPAVTGVTVAPTSASVAEGATTQLTASVLPAGVSQAVTWSSADPLIATVNSSGLVTGVAQGGPVNITATSVADDTKTASAAITVTS